MRLRVFLAVCDVRNPSAVPYLEHFPESPDAETRLFALMGLRAIGSLRSAPTFLRELDDPQQDMDFIAMQALIELAGGGQLDWYAGDFFTNPS
jgi:HEAT repeat protein